MKKPALVIYFILFALSQGASIAAATQAAFVQNGAFLLSREAAVFRDNRFYHDIVGYIPVGTVVYYEAGRTPKDMFNYERGQYEHYVWVNSDIGIAGLLRTDLKRDIVDDILVPVANRRVVIQTSSSTKYDAHKLSEFSRADGVFLTVIDDADPDFFVVDLPWTASPDRPPDRGKLFKRFVEDGQVRRLSPETVETEYPRVYEKERSPSTEPPVDAESDYLRDISEKIAARIDDSADAVHLFLKNLEQIRCILSSDADLDMGVKIFGAGLGLNFALSLKEKDRFWDLGKRVYYKGDRIYKEFVTLKAIGCRDNSPYRMEHFMLSEAGLNPNRRVLVWADDIDRNLAPAWGPSAQGSESTKTMFPITGIASYERAFSFLETQSENGSGYLAELTPADRRILINIILSEIAFFTKPQIRP
ncbi:MAG: hypothetical protein K9K88_07570 [Desulfobacterales bacterium]|nr:hypothetical protein [Desulfobacterales bacterium]